MMIDIIMKHKNTVIILDIMIKNKTGMIIDVIIQKQKYVYDDSYHHERIKLL